MSEPLSTSSVTRQDHQFWKQEHGTWREDIALWQEEHDAMLTALQALEQVVKRHGKALATHADAINKHEAALDLCDRVSAEQEVGYEHPGAEAAEHDDHQRQGIAHFQQRQTHERMKREHFTLVGQLELLDSILNE